MRDPMTVAFEIRYPWLTEKPSKLWPKGYRASFITIWHVDPSRGGDDDSCGWCFPHLSEAEKNLAHELAGGCEIDNLNHWFPADDKQDDRFWKIARMMRVHSKLLRPWWKHPRFHFWHWRFQIHPLQAFKRWVFSRCAGCRGRFTWGYSPISNSWRGQGPRWFRSEEGIYHHECIHARVATQGN